MRQIKFRGKRLDNGVWIYGDLIHIDKSDIGIVTDYDHWSGCRINPDTIGQFTGLTDCNGREIYEGDIFTVNGKYPKLVEYREDRAAFCIANVDELDKEWIDPWQQPAPDWWYSFSREIVVVGNKFDNSDLITNQPTEV